MWIPEYIQEMLKSDTGFEIAVEKIKASFKISQNRNQKDYQNIIKELSEINIPPSKLMSTNLNQNT